MRRDYKLYINDTKESIKQIEKYIKNISEIDFNNNKLIQDAVMENSVDSVTVHSNSPDREFGTKGNSIIQILCIRRLEIIGEASRNIPKALKEKNRHIAWFQMSQFRDFIVHSYFEAGLKRIWKAATGDIQIIKENLRNIVFV